MSRALVLTLKIALLAGNSATAQSYMGRAVLDPALRQPGQKLQALPPSNTEPGPTPTPPPTPNPTYAWQAEPWGSWSSSCSMTATRTRMVTCTDTSTNQTVADDFCPPATRPHTSEGPSMITHGCSFSWQTGPWSGWSSTCSTNAVRTRTVTCVQEMTDVTGSDAQCDHTPKPTAIEGPTLVTGGCSTLRWGIPRTPSNRPSMGECIGGQMTGMLTFECMNTAGSIRPHTECAALIGPRPPSLTSLPCTNQGRIIEPAFSQNNIHTSITASNKAWISLGFLPGSAPPTEQMLYNAAVSTCSSFPNPKWKICLVNQQLRWASAPGGRNWWVQIQTHSETGYWEATSCPCPGTATFEFSNNDFNTVVMERKAGIAIPYLYPSSNTVMYGDMTRFLVSPAATP